MDEVIENTVMEDWAEIEALFPTRRAMRPNKAWTNGISTRAGQGRLTRMTANPGAGPLAAKLDQMDDARVKAMRTFAAVNLEQASNGFRLTLVANVTVPVLVLTVANLLSPNGIGAMFLAAPSDEGILLLLIAVIVFALLTLTSIITYALAGLNQARDIRHIIDLQAAERGIYFGLEDIDEMHSA